MFEEYYNKFCQIICNINKKNYIEQQFWNYEIRFGILILIRYMIDNKFIELDKSIGNLLNINYDNKLRSSKIYIYGEYIPPNDRVYQQTVEDSNLVIAYELILKQLEEKYGI